VADRVLAITSSSSRTIVRVSMARPLASLLSATLYRIVRFRTQRFARDPDRESFDTIRTGSTLRVGDAKKGFHAATAEAPYGLDNSLAARAAASSGAATTGGGDSRLFWASLSCPFRGLTTDPEERTHSDAACQ
jgi:hypothetical protein